MKNGTDCERKSLETEYENLKDELKNARAERCTLLCDLNKAHSEIEDLNKAHPEIEDLKKVIRHRDADYNYIRRSEKEAIEKLKACRNYSSEAIIALQTQVATAKEEVKKWQNECENIKAELKNVRIELEDMKEIARMRLDLFNKASTERNELHKKLEEQRDKEQEVYDDSENVTLKSINNALQTQVATAKEEVKKMAK